MPVPPEPRPQAALVLFSGGQDSTTCLAWARQTFAEVSAVVFHYGQRHAVELEQAQQIADSWDVPLHHQVVSTGTLPGVSALTDTSMPVDAAVPDRGLPNTFVPGRNLVFLNYAGILAWQHGIPNLVGGMCEADYSGYPDCRRGFVDAAEQALQLGLDFPFRIHTPLMFLDKAAIWRLAADLGCLDTVVKLSHTCYQGDRVHLHRWGYGCGVCPACVLRARGFEKAFPQVA